MKNYRAWPRISEVKIPMLAASPENGWFMEKDCFGALEPFAILIRMVQLPYTLPLSANSTKSLRVEDMICIAKAFQIHLMST
jgi:hypothetical protein